MAMTNAERQAKYRAEGKKARAGLDGAIGPLSAFNVTMLTRIFGPRLAIDDASVAALVAAEGSEVHAVDWFLDPNVAESAIGVLMGQVLRAGLGDVPLLGWAVTINEGRARVGVYQFKRLAEAA